MARGKSVLTTGEVARICKVAPRTVSKWFDTGQLIGYRIPGSKDRRIPIDQLVRFMHAHGIPLNGLETGVHRVLVIDGSPHAEKRWPEILNAASHYEAIIAATAFGAGISAGEARPHAIIVVGDASELQSAQFAREVRSHKELATVRLLWMRSGDRGKQALPDGFDAVIPADSPPDAVRAELDRICT